MGGSFFGSSCRTLQFAKDADGGFHYPLSQAPKRGALSRVGARLWYVLPPQRSDRERAGIMVKSGYCERIHTDFPVIFAGETYVGEGAVFNVSIPGCAIHSRKQVQAGTYQALILR